MYHRNEMVHRIFPLKSLSQAMRFKGFVERRNEMIIDTYTRETLALVRCQNRIRACIFGTQRLVSRCSPNISRDRTTTARCYRYRVRAGSCVSP
jgi:hypothetical protein